MLEIHKKMIGSDYIRFDHSLLMNRPPRADGGPGASRALVLKAEGYSYREIMDITGWTYTKVNRCMAEGRKAFLENFGRIEAGKGR